MMKSAQVTLALAAIALTGCSAAKSAAVRAPAAAITTNPRAAALDPCTLATRSEAAQAMGKPSAPGRFRKYGLGFCHWDGPTVDYEVYIQLMPGDLVDGYTEVPGATVVHGIGDEAIWGTSGALYVRKGAYGAEINFTAPGSSARMTPAQERFAREVAARM